MKKPNFKIGNKANNEQGAVVGGGEAKVAKPNNTNRPAAIGKRSGSRGK